MRKIRITQVIYQFHERNENMVVLLMPIVIKKSVSTG